MKKLLKFCFSNGQKILYFFQKTKDPYNVQSLFQCYSILISLFIIEQLIRYFVYPRTEHRNLLIFIPIGALSLLLIFLYCLKNAAFRSHLEKGDKKRNIIYFDFLKVVIYLIFSVVLIESRVFEAQLRQSEIFQTGFWVSVDFLLISKPAFIFLQNSISKLGLIIFQFLYSYLRLSSWEIETLRTSFIAVKIILLIICLQNFVFFDDKIPFKKNVQISEKKFSSKVLDILPEGVAIVDENGLLYHNNSLETILRVKTNDCFNALQNLENKEYVKSSIPHHLIKRVFSFDPQKQKKSPTPSPRQNAMCSLSSPTNKNKITSNFTEEKSIKTKDQCQKTSEEKPFDSSKKHLSVWDPNDIEVKQLNSEQTPINLHENINLTIFTDQNNTISSLKKNMKTGMEKSTLFNGTPQKQRNHHDTEDKFNKLSIAEIGSLKLKLKHIIDRIYRPYEKSRHKTSGEAIKELLQALKDQFNTQDSLFLDSPEFVRKQKQAVQFEKKKFLSKSATFNNNNKAKNKVKSELYTSGQWALIMNSEKQTPNGHIQRLEIKFTPIIFRGKPSLIILVRDVTELEIIKQLEEKEKNQSAALAAISHEFRTPLNGILGMLETLKDQISFDISQNYLLPAYNSAKLLLTLVNDILDFHQMKEQKLTLVPVNFNIRSKLNDSLSLISFQAKRRGLEVKLEIDDRVPKYIQNDPNRMQQVVNNLLGNAIKFTTEGSITLKVELYSSQQYIIKVVDTGIGIESHNLSKLFKSFGKIDSQKNRELNPQGVGLGLTISNKLACLLCSDLKIAGLHVESEFHKGSAFWFVLDNVNNVHESNEFDEESAKPLSEKVEDINKRVNNLKSISYYENPQDQNLSSSIIERNTERPILKVASQINWTTYPPENLALNAKILNTETQIVFTLENMLKQIISNIKSKTNSPPLLLVADDNDINHLVFQSFLKGFDIKVDSAYNGKQAIQKILQKKSDVTQQYSIIFLDLEMPTMGGIECTEELKKLMENEELKEIPIIGQSGHNDPVEKAKCLKAGMSDYLEKPISKALIIDTLIKWLLKEYDTLTERFT